MSNSPAYQSRRTTYYSESRDYSSRPSDRSRASSVDPYRDSATSYSTSFSYRPHHNRHNPEPLCPIDRSLPPAPLPRSKLIYSNYRSTASPLYPSSSGYSRSNSVSRLNRQAAWSSPSPVSGAYHYPQTLPSYSSRPIYRQTRNNYDYGFEPPPPGRKDVVDGVSKLSIGSTTGSQLSPSFYPSYSSQSRSDHSGRRLNNNSDTWTEIPIKHQHHRSDDWDEGYPRPTVHTHRVRVSPAPDSPRGVRASSVAPMNSNANNGMRYQGHRSPGLHGGRATNSGGCNIARGDASASSAAVGAIASTGSGTGSSSSPPSSSTSSGNNVYTIVPIPNSGLLGLSNLGNTCFMNSVIQCLSHTPELLRVCLDKTYFSELNVNSSMKGNLFKAYADLMRQLWMQTGSSINYVNPQSFRSQIQKYAPRFMGYAQQDAQEFLRYLVQGLHEDVNRVTQSPKAQIPNYDEEDRLPDEKKAALYWERYKRIDDSIIADLFQGQLMSTLECMVCNHKSTTFDPFWDLSLPIPRSGDVDIKRCFDLFTSKEILDGSDQPENQQPCALPTCSQCKRQQRCIKRFFIQRFPTILVIHFKRFSGERSRSKLTTFINYGVDQLDLTRYASSCSPEQSAVYRLYAVSNHSGSVHGGHYTAYCLHHEQGSWFEFNDTSVRRIHKGDVVSSEAYVLFYQRVGRA